MNPIEPGTVINDKTGVLDLKIQLNNEEIINLEMQVNNSENWPERSLTYLCRIFDSLQAGEDYSLTKRTIHIGILDFTPAGYPEDLYMDYYLYNKKNDHYYSSKFGIYLVQLNQVENEDYEETMPQIYHWARLFKATTWEEIRMLTKKEKSMEAVMVTLKELTDDEKTRMACEQREKNRKDWANSARIAREEGREEGMIEIVQKMSRKLSVQEIADMLGERPEKIQKLLQK